MLHEAPHGGISVVGPIPHKARLALWSLALLDVMTVAWMLSAGDWLDRANPVAAVITLGGHHLFVLWLAVAGFVTLVLLTVLTGALTVVRRIHVPFLVLGSLASAVALGGVASVTALVVGAMLLVAVVGGAILGGGRFVFLSGLLRRR